MNEAFLHHLWKFRLFDSAKLTTTDGEEIEVLKTGQHNSDSGPDFFNAQVRIGGTTWAGNIEIHLKSSDWKRHGHGKDAAYDNVVLHVVFEHDEEISTTEKRSLPTLQLKDRFNPLLFDNYTGLVESNRWIPCEEHIHKVEPVVITSVLERMLIQRMEEKTHGILESLRINRNNWDETFYQHLARNFGFKTNTIPFDLLAKSLPLQLIRKHNDKAMQVEALLFGQAGMLEAVVKNKYGRRLKKEYSFLRKKYSLKPINAPWKFMRLRPSNFPTVRIAQFAQLVRQSSGLFTKITSLENLEELRELFKVTASEYWDSHYRLKGTSLTREKALGDDSVDNILINTVVPFLFAWGRFRNESHLQDRAFSFLRKLPSERNMITEGWKKLGIASENASQSQSLIQLKNDFCAMKKCLICSVGNKIINSVS